MYICRHFNIEELVPKELFDQYKYNQYRLWLIFDERILYIIDKLRDDYGPMTCNDWLWGGNRNMSGFRPFSNNDIGASLSQHKFGRAFDLIPKNIHPSKIREDIVNNKKEYMKDIKAIEMNISWLHIDVRNNINNLIKFKP